MVLDDSFGNREPEPGAMRLSEGGKSLEDFTGDLRGNSGAGILDLRHDLVRPRQKAKPDFAASRHGIGSVVDQVEKDPAQTLGIEAYTHLRRFIFQFQRDRLQRRLG